MNPDSPDDSTPSTHPAADESNHPDPITGEPGAHPVGVGVGAVGAGLAGAAIGLIAGPLGALVGAAIGVVAGGLAGHEVAAADDEPVSLADQPLTGEAAAVPVPLDAGLAGSPAGEVPEAGLSTAPVIGLAGMEVEKPAGQFHEAFTTQTWQEAVEEERIAGNADPVADSLPTVEFPPVGEATTPQGFMAGETRGAEETIRGAAYFRYVHREATGEPGDAFDDWISAEREVLG